MENSWKSINRFKMKFGGKNYDTQFTSTGKKRKDFMHAMQKLPVDAVFTQMTSRKGIKKHGDILVAAMHKKYTQSEDMKVMVAPDTDSLTRTYNKGELWVINLIKFKTESKTKR